MADREKVIKGLKMCKIDFCDACPYDDEKPCTLALKQDALDLIEEMRNKISEELVRCKNCKHRLKCDYWLEKGDDWYCGDGEPKESR